MTKNFDSSFYESYEEFEAAAIEARKIPEKNGARPEDLEQRFSNISLGCTDEIVWTIINDPTCVSEWAEKNGLDSKSKLLDFTNFCLELE